MHEDETIHPEEPKMKPLAVKSLMPHALAKIFSFIDFRIEFFHNNFFLRRSNSLSSQKLLRLKPSYGKLLRQVGVATTIPMILVAGPLLGYGIGYEVDHYFGTDPWGKVVASLLGLGASFKQVVSIIRQLMKEEE